MTQHLYGLHDANSGWGNIIRDAGMSAWAVISESIGDEPTDRTGVDYRWLSAYNVTPIVRLNYSHHGEGNIPPPNRYSAFAERCANFVTTSAGCTHWIIGNEPNLAAERYKNIPITPKQYADCFGKCRTQILHRGVEHEVMPAAIAPYNADTGWCLDYWREMLSAIVMTDGGADGLALHTYSRGSNPASITSEDRMDAPYQKCHNGFRAYRDFLALVPAIMRALPVYITETDQLEPWADRNSGWVQGAYAEINDWNDATGNQGIHCLALYRWQKHDQWYIDDKQGVIDDFRNAVSLGYRSPITPSLPIEPPETPDRPPEPEPEPPVPASGPLPGRDIDPALIARGVEFDFVTPPAGTWYWAVVAAEHLNEQEADEIGPDHHILGNSTRGGDVEANIPFLISWPSGSTVIRSKPPQPGILYNYDFPMSSSLNEFSIWVNDGAPTDKVSGIGMGAGGNPSIHTSTYIDWQWVQVPETVWPPEPEPEPPTPIPPIGERLIWPVTGPVTQFFGSHGITYAGAPGHDGIDFAVVTGTPVKAVADGIVKWVGFDRDGFGEYIRIFHPGHGFHSFMGHLSQVIVAVGQTVKQGQTVALSGSTGNSTGPHLHFSTRIGEEDDYYELHDGYSNGCANPLVVYGLINRVDPNSTLLTRG